MRSTVNKFLLRGVLLLGAVYFLLPIWWLIVSATKSSTQLFGSPPLWFAGGFSLFDNIRDILTTQDGLFGRWLLNTFLYAGVGAAGATLFSAAAGYVLAKYEFRGREAIFVAILASVLLPAALLVIPLYLLFSQLGIINTIWAVLIPSVVSPFGVFLSRIYAKDSISDDLIAAARVDGAGDLRIFFTISLRIMSPALITVFLFSFVGIWNNFFLPMVTLTDNSLWPVTLGLYFLNSQPSQMNYNLVITGALLSTIPLIAAFFGLQKFWRADLSAGAMKM